MNTRGRQTDDRVADRDVCSRQQRTPFSGADREACEVVIAVLVEPGHFGGFPSDQRAAGFPAALGDTGNDRGDSVWVEFTAGEIVEKEQRLRALHDEVVD